MIRHAFDSTCKCAGCSEKTRALREWMTKKIDWSDYKITLTDVESVYGAWVDPIKGPLAQSNKLSWP